MLIEIYIEFSVLRERAQIPLTRHARVNGVFRFIYVSFFQLMVGKTLVADRYLTREVSPQHRLNEHNS